MRNAATCCTTTPGFHSGCPLPGELNQMTSRWDARERQFAGRAIPDVGSRDGWQTIPMTTVLADGRPSRRRWAELPEQLQDERGCLIRLGKDGNPGLLQDLGADEFAHAGCDVGVGNTAIGSSRVLGSDCERTSNALQT